MKRIYSLIFLLGAFYAQAQTPEVTSWILNTTNATGYGGYLSNVQKVQYSTANVYISCTCIPGYDIGPWQGNPNVPANQNFIFKITRTPQQNTGTAVATPLGHIGVWTNGVSIFNAQDAMSYNNQKVWNQNAILVEGSSFDACLGHPAPNGEYHHHLNPTCLYNDKDSTHHSPIIGYAFDGFPIYGAYGYTNTDGTGAIKRMVSGYRARNITARTTLPDGSTASSAGPAVSAQYPMGYYIEDFEFVQGLGDLDVHNGRFCKTPEYPNGTYAYFVTLDASGKAAYPYILGPQYYGTVQSGNSGPGSGHNTPAEPVQNYNGGTATGISTDVHFAFSVYPNPASDILSIETDFVTTGTMKATFTDALGREAKTVNLLPVAANSISLQGIAQGVYFVKVEADGASAVQRILIK